MWAHDATTRFGHLEHATVSRACRRESLAPEAEQLSKRPGFQAVVHQHQFANAHSGGRTGTLRSDGARDTHDRQVPIVAIHPAEDRNPIAGRACLR